MAVRYYEHHVKAHLKNRRKLTAFLQQLVRDEYKDVKRIDLTYVFCNDEYLLEMNEQFLQHNTLTDIITFDLTEDTNALHGEVYISTERVQENARKFQVQYEEELHRVIFHGALHLCGYKDKKAVDKVIMRAQEDRCLQRYFND